MTTKPFDPSKPLDNVRHEAFSLAMAKGSKQSTAYRGAGFKPKTDAALWSEASKLVRHPKVAARIVYLQERAAHEAVLTKSWLIGTAQSMLADAREAGARGPAARILELLGRERSTFVEKKEIGRPGDFSGMTDAELDEYIARAERELVVSPTREKPPPRSNGPGGALH